MPEKIKVGGVIQNDQLASVSVLAVKDRPGIAAAVLDALGQRGLNVQFVVQVIDHEDHDQMVLCVDRGDLPACLAAIEALRPELQPAAVVSQAGSRFHRHLRARFPGAPRHRRADVPRARRPRHQHPGHQHVHLHGQLHH